MTPRLWTILGAAAVALWVLFDCFFIVHQTQQAVVQSFGQPVRVINATGRYPGLQIKWPFVENVILLDRRNLAFEAAQEEIITADQERLVVDAYVRYQINDPLQYFRTLRTTRDAEDRLERLVNSSLRQVLGTASANDVIAGRRAQLTLLTRNDVIARAQAARLGITIIDVRIKRADLPTANQQAVFGRMNTNLQQQAAQIRYDGERQRREIVANAQREVTVTLAQATEQSGQIRGTGDAQATALYNASFGRDPGFAAFYRSMQAYETSMRDSSTTMVLSPRSDFFRYFENGASGGGVPARR